LLVVAGSCGASVETPSVPSDAESVETPSVPSDAESVETPSVPSDAESAGSAVGGAPTERAGITDYEAVVVATVAHDPAAYTQGLEFVDGLLLESTGLVGESSIRLVDPETGDVLAVEEVPEPLFAEGATVVGDEIWQLTWQNEVLLIRSLDDLEERRRLAYRGEGWGLCATEDRLIMSDGSSRLTFRDRETFEVLGSVEVTDGGEPLQQLNELECVGDRVWANVYLTARIVSIDPDSGAVDGSLSVEALVPEGIMDDDPGNVSNGIAYNRETGRFWLTGKRWPVMYEVELRPIG
ncbi:MAG: glutaminyl-peptide cyclotransferase, partial [Acidimicrobiales bacterium]